MVNKKQLPDTEKAQLDNLTPDQLITLNFQLEDWMKSETERFNTFMAPTKQRIEDVKSRLFAKLVEMGGGEKAQISTDAGTAYISNLMNVSVSEDAQPWVDPETNAKSTGRMALLDFALANWEEFSDLLLVQPQKDSVRRYMETHDNQPPPGLRISWFQRVNVRRS